MRAPLKYVQGKDCLLHFYGDTSELGKNYLFVCSRSGHKACHAKIENILLIPTATGSTKSLEASVL